MTAIHVQLLDEVEEEYALNRVLPLYMFAWSLAGLGRDRSDSSFYDICRKALDEFRRRHIELELVEVPWPIDIARARPLASGVALALDVDPDAPRPHWLQALVHPDELSV